MDTNSFIKLGPKVKTKTEAVGLIAGLLSDVTSPTFGYLDEDGYRREPMGQFAEEGDENVTIVREYETALRLAGVLAKKWDIPFDPDLFGSTMGLMRNNGNGLWNSSSIGC